MYSLGSVRASGRQASGLPRAREHGKDGDAEWGSWDRLRWAEGWFGGVWHPGPTLDGVLLAEDEDVRGGLGLRGTCGHEACMASSCVLGMPAQCGCSSQAKRSAKEP